MHQSSARIRVVVPAFRSDATIRDCVQALHLASLDDIVVVDDGGNQDLSGALSPYPVDVRKTPGHGSAAMARNAGCVDFRSGILVFVDSDVIVDPGAIAALIEPITSGRSDATMGTYSCDVSGLPFGARYKQLYVAKVYERRVGPLRNDFWTAIAAVRAEVFHELGGFNPRFRGACGEDSEFGVRLTAAGHRIVGVAEASGRHHHPLSVSQVFANDWRKGRAAMALRASSASRLSDNKHATSRDVAAVGTAPVLLATLATTGLPHLAPAALAAALVTFASYGLLRSDLLSQFKRAGTIFAMQAGCLMWGLDLLRFACVVSHLATHLRPAAAPARKARRAEYA